MDSKLLLVKAITLLYRESQLEEGSDGSADLVRQIVETIKTPENVIEGDRTRDVIVGLKETALWMSSNPPNYDYDKNILLQRIRVNTGYETNLYDAFADGLYDVDTDEEIKKICLDYRDVLRSYINHTHIQESIKKASQKILFNEETIDWKTFVQNHIAELEPYANLSLEGQKDSMDSVDLSNIKNLTKMFERSVKEVSNEGTMKTGWQGLNRMTGEHNGGRRGEFWLIGALQHNFKSGIILSLFKQTALYNTPTLTDPTKKPLLIHLSFENNMTDNLIWLYVNLMENETGEECDVNKIELTTEEMAVYVRKRMMENGWHVKMFRENPSEYGFHDLFDMVNKLESQGYEVHMIACDYANMMTKRGCVSTGPSGDDIRDLFRRIRNFTTP